MTEYLAFDSKFRDREAYANPHDYEVSSSQVASWANGPLDNYRRYIKVVHVIVPYTEALTLVPVIYLNVQCNNLSVPYKIKQIDGYNKDAKFALILDKIQLDSDDAPTWIHYKANGMSQVMPFRRGDSIKIRLFDKDGTSLPGSDAAYPTDPTETAQTYILLESEQYREGIPAMDTY